MTYTLVVRRGLDSTETSLGASSDRGYITGLFSATLWAYAAIGYRVTTASDRIVTCMARDGDYLYIEIKEE